VGYALFGTVVGFCFAVAVYTRAKFFLCNKKISKTERIVVEPIWYINLSLKLNCV
jgi:hypothetical protein